jgi:Na+-transporting methylmalonyl-CoA/oxaloacetate decarboxylase gamma subunit
MFSAWDFNSWISSIGVVLVMLFLLTGFSALVSALMTRIWGDVRDDAATAHMSRTPKEPPIRKAA